MVEKMLNREWQQLDHNVFIRPLVVMVHANETVIKIGIWAIVANHKSVKGKILDECVCVCVLSIEFMFNKHDGLVFVISFITLPPHTVSCVFFFDVRPTKNAATTTTTI